MPKIGGQEEYEKFERGERLTRREAIFAQCYVCTGRDCESDTCPLYQFMPYRKDLPKARMSEKHRRQVEDMNRRRQG